MQFLFRANRPSLLAAALCFALLAGGCSLSDAGDGAPGVEVVTAGEAFRLTRGEAARLRSGGALFRFEERTSDSRCPVNVECISAGRVTLRVSLAPAGGEPKTFEMTGFVGPEGDGQIAKDTLGYRVTATRVDPYPTYNLGSEETTGRDQAATGTFRLERRE